MGPSGVRVSPRISRVEGGGTQCRPVGEAMHVFQCVLFVFVGEGFVINPVALKILAANLESVLCKL